MSEDEEQCDVWSGTWSESPPISDAEWDEEESDECDEGESE